MNGGQTSTNEKIDSKSTAVSDASTGQVSYCEAMSTTQAVPCVVASDPSWAHAFTEESTLIHCALRPHLVQCEHVGSTAVPELPARPVIDIAVALCRAELPTTAETWRVHTHPAFIDVRAGLERLGYTWDGATVADQRECALPDAEVFRKGPLDRTLERSHHVYVTLAGSPSWQRLVGFRNHLRSTPDAAARYATVKTTLAGRTSIDAATYTRHKTQMIEQLEHDALCTCPEPALQRVG